MRVPNPFSAACGKNLETLERTAILLITAALGMFVCGCSLPSGQPLSNTTILTPDQEDGLGGSFVDSLDIRTIAGKMTAALLSTPEIAGRSDTVRIAVAPIRNSTRYMIDKDIFMKRLRIELQKTAEGKVRFFSQDLGQETRTEILRDREQEQWDSIVELAATALAASPAVSNLHDSAKVAILPVRNTNLVGVNADSLNALLRAKVAEQTKGKIVFLSREMNGKVIEPILDERDAKDQGMVTARKTAQLYGVDYFLGGEFVGKSTTGESGNVTKYLLVKLMDADTGSVPFEKLFKVEERITSGVARADYLLTGEISALSKAADGGDRSDYVIMSFQLVDPKSNEVLWEEAYETKKQTSKSVVYK